MTLNSISVTNGVPLSKCIGTATSAGNENQIILFSNSAYAKVYIRFCFLIIVIIFAFLGIDQRVYSNYETGKREIPTRFVISLARLYNTSTDYILGMTNETRPYK